MGDGRWERGDGRWEMGDGREGTDSQRLTVPYSRIKKLGDKKEKMKNRTLASLEIAIVFCLLFLVALPGIGIASASEDETLDIYGNAN